MKIRSLHERALDAPITRVGELVDGLSQAADHLWPTDHWPAMRLDGPLGLGARGGHGPVGYLVSEYEPGRRVAFRFDGTGLTAGLNGTHRFDVMEQSGERVVLRHLVEADCGLTTWLKWRLVIGPLHDALLEDALDRAQLYVGGRIEHPARWSFWVRLLRRGLTPRKKVSARSAS